MARGTGTAMRGGGAEEKEPYPGERIGLPESGRGSLASWGRRLSALAVDWLICTAVSALLFTPAVFTANGWYRWATLLTFFVLTTGMVTLTGASAGQLLCRIGVLRLDRRPVGVARAALRAAMVCLVLPAVVIGTDRRGLHDLAAGTAVVNRR